MTLNLALLFVFQLATVEFFFRNRENLLHRFFEFVGGFLLGRGWHGESYAPDVRKAILSQFRFKPALLNRCEHFQGSGSRMRTIINPEI